MTSRSGGFNSGLSSGLPLLAAVLLVLAFGLPSARAQASELHSDIDYGTTPGQYGSLNQLDLYLPDGQSQALRPIVVYVHGGGWRRGDKALNITDKANLFTGAGYLFASVNYRLSPNNSLTDPPPFDPDRVRFPIQPQDVARAIAWIAAHAREYGGDPDSILLVGFSAGAQLVSLVGTNQTFLDQQGVSPKQVIGVVSLDTATFDVTDDATQVGPKPSQRNVLTWNAFGTPAEEAEDPRWAEASPLNYAGPHDPRFLLVTEAAVPGRIQINNAMAEALGQSPDSVLPEPLDHGGINAAVGQAGDPTGETAAIMNFISGRLAAYPPLKVKIKKRPAKKVRLNHHKKKRKVVFKFKPNRTANGLQCRIDRKKFKNCHSPVKYRLRKGRHVFRVRARYPSDRFSPHKQVKFRIVKKKHGHRNKGN